MVWIDAMTVNEWYLLTFLLITRHWPVSALLDISVFVDFVNATFVPVLFLACLCLFFAWRHYDNLL
jgi:hypothetical protein